jgi:RNA polymerase sigma-70 factor (ECF subfamily)
MKPSDQQLIQDHLAGDTQAFEAMVRRYGPGLLGYLSKLCASLEDAEDCFQEVFQRAHAKAHTVRGDRFRSWLFRVATNLAMDGFRQNKRRRAVSLFQTNTDDQGREIETMRVLADKGMNPAEQIQLSEQTQQVRDAVQSLPEKQRATLILAYYQQLTYHQVAQALGCSVGTVKQQMYRALKVLAQKLPDPG